MKKLMSIVFGLSLLVPVASFAQDTGGSTDKQHKVAAATAGKKASKTKEAHKGGKKGKKGTEKGTTTPPPK